MFKKKNHMIYMKLYSEVLCPPAALSASNHVSHLYILPEALMQL